MATTVAVVLLLVLGALPAALGCSCPIDAFQVSRLEAIERDFCASYISAVYSGVVMSVTCNCIPGSVSMQVSSTLNCQQYQLNPATSTVNGSTLTAGTCASGQFQGFYYNPPCAQLGTSVSGSLPVAMSDAPVEQTNLTSGTGCREACLLQRQDDPFFPAPQPCTYTVRVTESFKGSYSEDDMVTVIGPDVSTSCGDFGRRLVLGSSYVVGVGGPCSPIGEWSLLSTYSSGELESLRSLETPCDATTRAGGTTVGPGGGTTTESEGTIKVGPTTAGPVVGGAMGMVPAAGLLGVMMALIAALQE